MDRVNTQPFSVTSNPGVSGCWGWFRNDSVILSGRLGLHLLRSFAFFSKVIWTQGYLDITESPSKLCVFGILRVRIQDLENTSSESCRAHSCPSCRFIAFPVKHVCHLLWKAHTLFLHLKTYRVWHALNWSVLPKDIDCLEMKAVQSILGIRWRAEKGESDSMVHECNPSTRGVKAEGLPGVYSLPLTSQYIVNSKSVWA